MTHAPRSWTFAVPVDVADVSPNRRLHHMARSRFARAHRDAAWLVWASQGRPRAQCRVRLDITLYRGRALDEFNASASCKHVIDGICVGALTPDDSPRWVAQGTLAQFPGREHVRMPRVVIVATEDPDEAR